MINSQVEALHKTIYLVMFLGGSQGIPSAYGIALPLWICAKSPGCQGEAVPLQLVLKTQVGHHANSCVILGKLYKLLTC